MQIYNINTGACIHLSQTNLVLDSKHPLNSIMHDFTIDFKPHPNIYYSVRVHYIDGIYIFTDWLVLWTFGFPLRWNFLSWLSIVNQLALLLSNAYQTPQYISQYTNDVGFVILVDQKNIIFITYEMFREKPYNWLCSLIIRLMWVLELRCVCVS